MSLIEISLFVVICSVSSVGIYNSYRHISFVYESKIEKNNIINAVNLTEKKAIVDSKNYKIEFNLKDKKIYYLNKEMNLNNKFEYSSKNIDDYFIRNINKEGKLDRGFTIEIKEKGTDKIYQKIIFNNNSSMALPLYK